LYSVLSTIRSGGDLVALVFFQHAQDVLLTGSFWSM
jgi:hypothetical protein